MNSIMHEQQNRGGGAKELVQQPPPPPLHSGVELLAGVCTCTSAFSDYLNCNNRIMTPPDFAQIIITPPSTQIHKFLCYYHSK